MCGFGKGLARYPRPCTEYPHRWAVDRCDACLRPYCRECLVRGGPQLLCRACLEAARAQAADALRQRHPGGRLVRAVQEQRGSLLAAGLVVLGLALLGTLVASSSSDPRGQAAVADALCAVVMADRVRLGRFMELGGAPVVAIRTSDGSEGGPYGARYLVERRNADARGWRSRTAGLPQELLFALCQPVTVARATFRHLPASPPESWARAVELYLSAQPPDEQGTEPGAAPVGRWTLAPTTDPQEFVFPPAAAQYIRLRILSRQGDAAFTFLGTFALGSTAAEPSSGNPPGRAPLLPE